ncbi:outer dense fiber protein 3-like protein 2 [Anopheles nili]|uniref:outer dense fiber protein 3-like protein 2 n=1 Tax=Anopheles nili TaxID=185578 RepID=UPI00237AF8B7|nr:outer dense fiber protein 3-like protein 2 [Anopheles nili]
MSQKNRGPGPAAYMLPTEVGYNQHDPRKDRKPMYTMRPPAKLNYQTLGPGPATYDLKKQTRIGGPRDPIYSLAARLKEMKQEQIPGPGAHNNHIVPTMKCKRPPMYSFGQRLDVANKDVSPAANRYDGLVYMIRPKAPCYSMRGPTKQIHALEGPGPAGYGPTSRNVTHKRSPNYSLRGGHPCFTERTPHPGPNRYGLMNLRMDTTAPNYSFGIKHPDWKDPMIIPGDNC